MSDVIPQEREVARIFHRENGAPVGSYSRACHDVFEFATPEKARRDNVHGMFEDRIKYRIARYRVRYELIEEDVFPPTEEDYTARKKKDDLKARREAGFREKHGLGPDDPIDPVEFTLYWEDMAFIERLDELIAKKDKDDLP